MSVEPETSQCLRAPLHAGAPVEVEVAGLAVDSLGARRIGQVPWDVVRRYVDEAVVVGDDAIRATQRAIWDELRLISEPGGATALAATPHRHVSAHPRRTRRRRALWKQLRPRHRRWLTHDPAVAALIRLRGRLAELPSWTRSSGPAWNARVTPSPSTRLSQPGRRFCDDDR